MGTPAPFFFCNEWNGKALLFPYELLFFLGTSMHRVDEGRLIFLIYKGHLGADCTRLLRIRRIIV